MKKLVRKISFQNNLIFLCKHEICCMMHVTDDSKHYVNIFTDLDKRDQIIKYYLKFNKNRLRKEWSSKMYANEYSKNPLMFFESFYEALIECKKQQVSHYLNESNLI